MFVDPGERGEGSGEEKTPSSSSSSSHHSATTAFTRFSRDTNRCSVQVVAALLDTRVSFFCLLVFQLFLVSFVFLFGFVVGHARYLRFLKVSAELWNLEIVVNAIYIYIFPFASRFPIED